MSCHISVVLTLFFVVSVKATPTRNMDYKATNNRPIVGIMSEASDPSSRFAKFGKAFIVASYVKYLESSGARVVPVRNDLSDSEIVKLFYSINGLLLPGGGVNLVKSGYARTARLMVKLAIESHNKGDYFPVWGTCLGFQQLCVIISENDTLLGNTDSYNYPIPLNFTEAYRNSRMFMNITEEVSKILSSQAVTMNMHHFSVYTSRFQENENLKNFFHVLSTNVDRNGVSFISTIEGTKYPIFATQWHPEKNTFEWTLNEDLPHSREAIQITQYMSDFFVNEARKSEHCFDNVDEETAALIYNFEPVFTGNISNYEQIYAFN